MRSARSTSGWSSAIRIRDCMVLTTAETSGDDATTAADSLFVLTFVSRDRVPQAGAQPVRPVSRVFGVDCDEKPRRKRSSLTACGNGRPSFEHARCRHAPVAGKMPAPRVAELRRAGKMPALRVAGLRRAGKMPALRVAELRPGGKKAALRGNRDEHGTAIVALVAVAPHARCLAGLGIAR